MSFYVKDLFIYFLNAGSRTTACICYPLSDCKVASFSVERWNVEKWAKTEGERDKRGLKPCDGFIAALKGNYLISHKSVKCCSDFNRM